MITLLTAAEVSESARAFLEDVSVAPEVFELQPDYRVLVMVAEGLEPGPPDEISDGLLTRAETRARITLGGRAPEDVPQVADWRAAYRAFGAKPQRTRPSVEALLRRLEAGLPRIDRLTDAYNAVSIANLVPVGGEDLDQYQGPARLVRAAGDEDFGTTAHGEPAIEHPRPGEVTWRDDAGVTCRQWNWRQCTRTRITTATTNAVFIIDGLAVLGRDGLTAAENDLASSLIRLSPQAAIASRLITLQPAPRQQENTRMLIHPWDAAISDTEWRNWLAGHDFGQLAVSDPGNGAPHVIPTHFAVDGDTLLVHLARPNKVWAAIQARPIVVMSVLDDYAYIPTTWRAKAGGPDEDGVPTSYYSAVQLTCRAEIVDDPQDKAELLRRQLAHFQPQGDHAQVAVDMPPYGRMLSGIRGLHLHITSVAAKFKYDDHNPQGHRAQVAERLETRGSGRDHSAAVQQRRRLKEIGEWKSATNRGATRLAH